MRRDNQQIKIASKDGTCYLQSSKESCCYTNTKMCLDCAINSGNTKQDIKFSTYYKVEPPEPKEPKKHNELEARNKLDDEGDTLQPQIKVISEKEDEPHFVEFLDNAVTHMHSGNFKMHTHYEIDEGNILLGNYCFMC